MKCKNCSTKLIGKFKTLGTCREHSKPELDVKNMHQFKTEKVELKPQPIEGVRTLYLREDKINEVTDFRHYYDAANNDFMLELLDKEGSMIGQWEVEDDGMGYSLIDAVETKEMDTCNINEDREYVDIIREATGLGITWKQALEASEIGPKTPGFDGHKILRYDQVRGDDSPRVF